GAGLLQVVRQLGGALLRCLLVGLLAGLLLLHIADPVADVIQSHGRRRGEYAGHRQGGRAAPAVSSVGVHLSSPFGHVDRPHTRTCRRTANQEVMTASSTAPTTRTGVTTHRSAGPMRPIMPVCPESSSVMNPLRP